MSTGRRSGSEGEAPAEPGMAEAPPARPEPARSRSCPGVCGHGPGKRLRGTPRGMASAVRALEPAGWHGHVLVAMRAGLGLSRMATRTWPCRPADPRAGALTFPRDGRAASTASGRASSRRVGVTVQGNPSHRPDRFDGARDQADGADERPTGSRGSAEPEARRGDGQQRGRGRLGDRHGRARHQEVRAEVPNWEPGSRRRFGRKNPPAGVGRRAARDGTRGIDASR